MKYIVTSEEMKRADAYTMNTIGIPSLVLMERAALKTVEALHTEQFCLDKVLVVCGVGNNGGDGMAVARLLFLEGVDVTACVVGNREKASDQAAQQLHILEFYGVPMTEDLTDRGYTTLVDALFGVGLSRDVGGVYADAVAAINAMQARVLAVDIASGVHSDTGQIMGCAVQADASVAFAFAKAGQLLYPGTQNTGKLLVADIGITEASFAGELPEMRLTENEDIWKYLKRRTRSNKGTYGKVLVIAGRKGVSGAAYFSASAAYHTGCGLVKIYTEESNRQILQTLVPEAMVEERELLSSGYPRLLESLSWADAVVLGPGIGTDLSSRQLLETVLAHYQGPLVLDADALTLLAGFPENVLGNRAASCVLTPHPGEMARLLHTTVGEITADIPGAARKAARKFQAVCVMKDARTVTAAPDGQTWINNAGSSALATGGSGDVLTGIIAALLAKGAPAFDGAAAAVRLHALTGEASAAENGVRGTLAGDLLGYIGREEAFYEKMKEQNK